ncbi:grpE protein homolog 2, mitochondrial-like isoform X2 [Impatiens glandulifera]|uniref:grpE protein homolog 2, mitochondrial-like isoform X2 n=1 Tax=Impatiens glandulifera TaxID=253017 RepID=UPI001FB112C0|nr:grpE protein homolog 2, mitochondrial-like isoform X2 [Impatiens glandulifera]
MSLSRVASRLSRTYPSFHAVRRHTQQRYLFSAPTNHIHTQNKVVPWQISAIRQSFLSFQQFGFSSTASPQHNEKENVAAKANEDAKVSDQTEASKLQEDSDSDQELTMEDMVKLVTEKEELLKVKQKEIENMKDKVLRSYAEMENVKERTRREAENVKKFAIQNFAKGLLDVADNLSRASSVVKDSFSKIDTSSDSSGAVPLLKTLLEGVEMTEKQLAEVFKKSGVERFDPTNEPFDPNRHNAVFQVPDASKPPGTVAVVLKVGYMLHERVLRPAEVGVTNVPEDDE